MPKTISEILFDGLCASRGITCLLVAEGQGRTPNRELVFGSERVIVEVKEITPNKEEQESDRLVAERGYGNVLSNIPGDRVRNKIAKCSPQIKARTAGQHASLLVLFDRGQAAGHIHPDILRVAMYGLEQVHFSVPPIGMGSPYSTGMSYGLKRKMTPEDNTSISAIGALFMTGPEAVSLTVYHNRYAKLPLRPALFAAYGIDQFELDEDAFGRTSKWREIALVAE
ncbi:MAG: hypothetical protein LC776_14100 [Acidobacteria bacterium]|nr:hypothetical protein [Acidobacteriota bacterium]